MRVNMRRLSAIPQLAVSLIWPVVYLALMQAA